MGILRRGEVLTIDGTGLSRQLPRYAQQRAGAVETGRRVFTLRVNRHFIWFFELERGALRLVS
jgi:hypothetical protein